MRYVPAGSAVTGDLSSKVSEMSYPGPALAWSVEETAAAEVSVPWRAAIVATRIDTVTSTTAERMAYDTVDFLRRDIRRPSPVLSVSALLEQCRLERPEKRVARVGRARDHLDVGALRGHELLPEQG